MLNPEHHLKGKEDPLAHRLVMGAISIFAVFSAVTLYLEPRAPQTKETTGADLDISTDREHAGPAFLAASTEVPLPPASVVGKSEPVYAPEFVSQPEPAKLAAAELPPAVASIPEPAVTSKADSAAPIAPKQAPARVEVQKNPGTPEEREAQRSVEPPKSTNASEKAKNLKRADTAKKAETPKVPPASAPAPQPASEGNLVEPAQKADSKPLPQAPTVSTGSNTKPVSDIPTSQTQASDWKRVAARPSATKPAVSERKPAPQEAPVHRVEAPPLVPAPFSPHVVEAVGERVWIKIAPQRTIIVRKGQSVDGLGAFRGTTGNVAQFENGTLPIQK